MKQLFEKSLLLIAAAALAGTSSVANAQDRINPTLKVPVDRGNGLVIMNGAAAPGGIGPVIANGIGVPELAILYPSQENCSGNGCLGNIPNNSHLPGSGFCGTWNNANQKVNLIVRNNGLATAGPSQVIVNFTNLNSNNLSMHAVPSLQAHETYSIQANVPDGAWSGHSHPRLYFNITADAQGAVEEADEFNNVVSSGCIGPAS